MTRKLWSSDETEEATLVGALSLDEIKNKLLNFLYNRARTLNIPEITYTLTNKLIEIFLAYYTTFVLH